VADLEKKIRIVYTVDGAERVATSLKELRAGAAELRKSFANATDIQQLQRYGAEINNVKEKMNELTATGRGWSSGATTGASNVAQAFQSMNYIVRDSPYFFKNFALGVLAVGNNINPFVDSLIRARLESQRLGTSLKTEMVNFLKGPGGLIFAFSLAVTAIQAYVFATEKGSKGNKEFADSFDDLIKSNRTLSEVFDALAQNAAKVSTEDIPALIRGIKNEIKDFSDEMEKFVAANTLASTMPGAGGFLSMLMGWDKASGNFSQATETLKNLELMGGRLNALKGLFKQGDLKTALSIFSREELETLNRTVREVADKTLPGLTKELDYNGIKFKTTAKDAKALADALDELLNPKKEKKTDKFTFVESLKLEREILESQGKDLQALLTKQVEMLRNEAAKTKDLKEQLKLYGEINNLNDQIAKIEKERAEAAKKQAEEVERMFNVIDKANRVYERMQFGVGNQVADLLKRGGSLGSSDEYFKSLKEQEELYEDMAQNIAGVFEDNMMQMWRNVFGEANSLVEQLGEAVANVFLNRFSNNVANWLLDLIPGGGILGDLFGAAPAGGGTPITIINQVDGRTINKMQYNALPGQVYRLQREGYL
jgi:hypothetical protein